MTQLTRPSTQLTLTGAHTVLHAAMEKADAMGIPMCITIVDTAGHMLAYARMDGAKTMSELSSRAKAETAASSRAQTGSVTPGLDIKLGLVTGGKLTNLNAGVPIEVDGEVIGAVGVGSGTGEEDLEVAQAGIAAFHAALTEAATA